MPNKMIDLQRRRIVVATSLAFVGLAATAAAGPRPVQPIVEVWKEPTCGCCGDWIAHLQKNGFDVRVHDSGNSDARERLGMPAKYGSCHTGKIGGYAIEGHVPAREIQRLLRDKPDAIGLAVPGMPIGSPGMDGQAYGNRKDPYDVLLVLKDGSTKVYQSYR